MAPPAEDAKTEEPPQAGEAKADDAPQPQAEAAQAQAPTPPTAPAAAPQGGPAPIPAPGAVAPAAAASASAPGAVAAPTPPIPVPPPAGGPPPSRKFRPGSSRRAAAVQAEERPKAPPPRRRGANPLLVFGGIAAALLVVAVAGSMLMPDAELNQALRTAAAGLEKQQFRKASKALAGFDEERLGPAGRKLLDDIRTGSTKYSREAMDRILKDLEEGSLISAESSFEQVKTRCLEPDAERVAGTVRVPMDMALAVKKAKLLKSRGEYGAVRELFKDFETAQFSEAALAIRTECELKAMEEFKDNVELALAAAFKGQRDEVATALKRARAAAGAEHEATYREAEARVRRIEGEGKAGSEALFALENGQFGKALGRLLEGCPAAREAGVATEAVERAVSGLHEATKALVDKGKHKEAWEVIAPAGDVSEFPDLATLKRSIGSILRADAIKAIEALIKAGKPDDAKAKLDELKAAPWSIPEDEAAVLAARIQGSSVEAAEQASLSVLLPKLRKAWREHDMIAVRQLIDGRWTTKAAKARIELEKHVLGEVDEMVTAALAELRRLEGKDVTLELSKGGKVEGRVSRISTGPPKVEVSRAGGIVAVVVTDLAWSEVIRLAAMTTPSVRDRRYRVGALSFAIEDKERALESFARTLDYKRTGDILELMGVDPSTLAGGGPKTGGSSSSTGGGKPAGPGAGPVFPEPEDYAGRTPLDGNSSDYSHLVKLHDYDRERGLGVVKQGGKLYALRLHPQSKIRIDEAVPVSARRRLEGLDSNIWVFAKKDFYQVILATDGVFKPRLVIALGYALEPLPQRKRRVENVFGLLGWHRARITEWSAPGFCDTNGGRFDLALQNKEMVLVATKGDRDDLKKGVGVHLSGKLHGARTLTVLRSGELPWSKPKHRLKPDLMIQIPIIDCARIVFLNKAFSNVYQFFFPETFDK